MESQIIVLTDSDDESTVSASNVLEQNTFKWFWPSDVASFAMPSAIKDKVILEECQLFIQQHLSNFCGGFGLPYRRIVSIDIGDRNGAISILEYPFMSLTSWFTFDVSLNSKITNATERCNRVDAILQQIPGYVEGDSTTLFLIERQRHRSIPKAPIMEYSHRNTLLEATFVSLLLRRHHLYDPRLSIVTPIVSNIFKKKNEMKNYDVKKRQQAMYALRKKASVCLIPMLLESGRVIADPNSLRGVYFNTSKRDDLCDSLLNAVSWVYKNKK